MTNPQVSVELLDDIETRFATHGNTHLFIPQYLPHYCKLPSAPFHQVLSDNLDDPDINLIEILGFRDSAKSTYATLAFPMRVALTGQYKFIVIINDTKEQVELTIANLKHELENNPRIRRDFSNVKVGFTWSKYNILLSNGVRIIGRSRGQNIRGIKHRENRPDLIIVDDPENLKQVKKKENRDATEAWFNAEVLPAKSAFGAKLIVIGNLLHNDGFIARLSKNSLFTVIRLPAIDKDGIPLWLDQYPTPEAIERKKTEVGIAAWSREYMLIAVVSEDQPIKETDIMKYPLEVLTKLDERGQKALIKIMDAGQGMDLAISEKETADCTAIVGGYRVVLFEKRKILVLPNPINKRMDFDATQNKAVEINKTMPHGTKWYIEDVGYQKAALQNLKKKGLSVYPMRPIQDKRARLMTIAPFVKDTTVLFPETGCEELIGQIINFGSEEHDDLVDAFVYLIMGLTSKPNNRGATGRPDAI